MAKPCCDRDRDRDGNCDRHPARRYYCEMCDLWFVRSGDCALCGYPLLRGAK